MSEKRFALIIANDRYDDESLRELQAPQLDADALAKVLGDPETCNFYVQILVNKRSHRVNQVIEAFFNDRGRDDLLLLYFSGHGLKDEDGKLYFATSDTNRKRLLTTSIPATLINDLMRRTRSRRQVLLLDCCYSGAFAKGMIAKSGSAVGSSIGTNDYFQGKGRVVLTASDAMQYAFEEGELVEEGAVNSLFTSAIVDGIETWKADSDGNDRITVTELYGYVDSYVLERTPHQRPSMWSFDTQGEIIIAEREHVPEVEDEEVAYTTSARWRHEQIQHPRPQISAGVSGKQVVVEGRNDPNTDAQAIQNAVDNYEEVLLRGKFNLGTPRIGRTEGATCVQIRKSVVIRGEGRENDIPSTKIYKHSWKFPSREDAYLLTVEGKDIDVTIENIHFTNFNSYCIANSMGNSVTIRNNRITLGTGLGRGRTEGQWGDHVIGIFSGPRGPQEDGFPGGTVIEGNYIDFAENYTEGGFIPTREVTDPNYRPNLKNHESYVGIGISLNRNWGKVIVRNNVIRNMNAKGILVQDSWESAEIEITGNTFISEVFGSYAYSSHLSGFGIQVISAFSEPRSGASVTISDNQITCDKLNYCGVAIYGQSMYRKGAGKLGKCIIRDNDIRLGDGSVGVLVRKNDGTEVFGNKLSGRAYYGFHLWGSKDREGFDLGSNANLVEDNDLTELEIKTPDEYSDNHVDGRMFTGLEGKSATAHVWLNHFSKRNVVKLRADETVIDEGEDNEITH